MDRKEFISLLGFGTITALTASQLASCSKEDTPPDVNFTLDLSASGNAALVNPGGYLIKTGIIIAHTLTGSYIAVSSVCTHQGGIVAFEPANDLFHCPNHDSRFSETGSVINGPATTDLRKYNTELSGNSLRIFI